MEKQKILNIELLNIELPSLLQQLERGVLITPNVDHLMKLQKDRGFYELYRKTEWIICDSNIVQLALRFLGNPVDRSFPDRLFSRPTAPTTKTMSISACSYWEPLQV